jgi:hypothetical protein
MVKKGQKLSVPIIKREKAEARLAEMLHKAGIPPAEFANRVNGKIHDVLLVPPVKLSKADLKKKPQELDNAAIVSAMIALRKARFNYHNALEYAAVVIEEIRPGGLVDQTIDGVIDVVEHNLVPWMYLAGVFRMKVTEYENRRLIARKMLEEAMDFLPGYGFLLYEDGSDEESDAMSLEKQMSGLLNTIEAEYLDDIKPHVLEAMTLPSE